MTAMSTPAPSRPAACRPSLLLSRTAGRRRRLVVWVGHALLFLVTSSSALAVLFIFYYIARDALPFFQLRGWREFFATTAWYPSGDPPTFGALALFVGSGLVTLGAAVVAVPLGILAAVCLSDILPFGLRQWVKPTVEALAAIPSVAYGFFALVVLAPLLQSRGGMVLAVGWWCLGTPMAVLAVLFGSDWAAQRMVRDRRRGQARVVLGLVLAGGAGWVLLAVGGYLARVQISSGTNALNVSIILGLMALPTIISISEDALQAVGRELREGAYALGATRAEVLTRVVLPAAASGICAAVILGIMRAIGETMVVWMASGNAAKIPTPWYNLLEPVRTVTATIAGDMGEADHVTGSARYHVLFALALVLLVVSFLCNAVSEQIVRRSSLIN